MVGSELVNWLMTFSSYVHSRIQAVGMMQSLLEEGALVHVCEEHCFKDSELFYRFKQDHEGTSTVPNHQEKRIAEESLQETLAILVQIGPDAYLRMVLRKPPSERTADDLELIYEELMHIKALSHLSTMVKKELASVLMFEAHFHAQTTLFNQGDEGKSWYIILKGKVNVKIYGKGIVSTLGEGDDFGKLALVNDAPRAATIVLDQDNCHFLRVDKHNFNRILRDVEANTVRLKEHGKDVLILEKIPSNIKSKDGSLSSHYKYSVMAGTPNKILEFLLDTQFSQGADDRIFIEDFLLTHIIFMPSNQLCPSLMVHYHAPHTPDHLDSKMALSSKKRVLAFVKFWSDMVGRAFYQSRTVIGFLRVCLRIKSDYLMILYTIIRN